MTEISTKININFDATLGISDTEAANLEQKLKTNLVGKDGIKDISYVNGQLAVEYEKGKEASVDTLAAKLQGIVFSSDEMKAFFGEDVKDVAFKKNLDGTITLTTNGVSETKKMSDFDIRELMKLLIAAFSELLTADRERALNVLTATVTAFENKIDAMETAAQEQYNSAIASAIGQIAGGCITVLGSIIGSSCTGASLGKNLKADKMQKDLDVDLKKGNVTMENDNTKIDQALTDDQLDQAKEIQDLRESSPKCGTAGQFFSGTAMASGQIVSGIAAWISAADAKDKSEADIDSTKADQLLEILKQAQAQYTKGNDSLQQFIDKVLSIMQQLLQSASQTEKAVANI